MEFPTISNYGDSSDRDIRVGVVMGFLSYKEEGRGGISRIDVVV